MFAVGDQQCPPVPIMEVDGRWRAHVQQAPNCPRCASTNTNFSHYNYSLAQPRYFCKANRRYWTKGGSLKNVPEGGGCRKTRRSRSKPNSSSLRDSPDPCPQGVNGSSSAQDIDLATVFARYLNHDSGVPSQEQDVQLVSQHVRGWSEPLIRVHDALGANGTTGGDGFITTDIICLCPG